MKRSLALFVMPVACYPLTAQKTYPFTNASLPLESHINNLISLLIIEEKVDQLKYNTARLAGLTISEFNSWHEDLHGVGRSGNATVFPQASGTSTPEPLSLPDENGKPYQPADELALTAGGSLPGTRNIGLSPVTPSTVSIAIQ